MGKKELKPTPIKHLIFAVFIILFVIGLYLVVFSAPISHLEAKIIKSADFEVEQTNQFTFSNGGQVVVAQDAKGDGLVQAYAKIPILNRYMKTGQFDFIDDGETSYFVAKEWSTTGAYELDQGVVTRPGVGEDWGLGGRVLYYLIWMEGFVIVMTLIRNDTIKTRIERAANPVKNY